MEGVMAGSKSVLSNVSVVKMHAILRRQQKFRATRIKAIILLHLSSAEISVDIQGLPTHFFNDFLFRSRDIWGAVKGEKGVVGFSIAMMVLELFTYVCLILGGVIAGAGI